MASATALKKDMGQRNLSPDPERPSPGGSPIGFDRGRLVQELLSLGNEKITPRIARKVGKEVEEELRRHPRPRVTPQLISDLVAFKLKEMGLIPDPASKELPHAEEEETVSLSTHSLGNPGQETNRTQGLLQKGQKTTLPTLEKFLKPLSSEELPVKPSASPPPPRAAFQAHPEALAEVGTKNSRGKNFEEIRTALDSVLKDISKAAASAEMKFPSKLTPGTLEVEFYNVMANQEFYPHFPTLLNDDRSESYGGHHVWVDLPTGAAATTQALADAQSIWKQGGCVSFRLDRDGGAGDFDLDRFEGFLKAIEQAILALPESVAIPRMIGLHLDASHPQVSAMAASALSGQFYPKFSISLALTEEDPLDLAEAIWSKSAPLLVFPKNLNPSTQGARELPRWGGGPLLSSYEVCHLGSLNLAILASGNDVDWLKLRRIVRTAVHFLDNLFEVTEYPLESIARKTRANRKIGLGVMGFAELLAKLGTPYDSDQALIVAEKIMRFINYEAMQASQGLARERGVFPDYALSPWKEKGILIRNASLNGMAPAPFLAKLAGVTPGISTFESVLEEAHRGPGEIPELAPLSLVKNISLQRKIWTAAMENEILSLGSVRKSTLAPQALRRLIAARDEISPSWQVRVQGAFQKPCEGTIGYSLEIPETESAIEFRNLFQWARELRLPALQLRQSLYSETKNFPETIQANRIPTGSEPEKIEGTASEVPEEEISAESEITETTPLTAQILPRIRPEVLTARTRQIQTPRGPMTITLASDETGPYELIARVGKSGSTENVHAEALSRLTSLLLSIGVDPQLIYDELVGLREPNSVQDQGEEILSIPDALAKFLGREGLIPEAADLLLESQPEEISARDEENFQGEYFESPEEDVTEVIEAETLH